MSAEPPSELRRHLVRSLATMFTLGLGVHFLLPQLAGLESTGLAIAHASWWLPLVLITLEAASLLSYGRLQSTLLLRSGQVVPEPFIQRTVVVGYAIGHALPGGTGTAFALIMAAFRRRGLDVVTSGTAVWAAGMVSTVVLMTFLPLAAVVGILSGGAGRIGLSVVIAAIGAVALITTLPLALRDPEGFAHLTQRTLVRLLPAPLARRVGVDRIADGVQRGASNIKELTTDRRVLTTAATWGAANWLLDLAVVVVLALTVGRGTPLAAIPLAYVVAQIAAAIPLTPGGVGIVEAAMVGALVAAGAPAAGATATVLGWRLISHWLPIPIGLALAPGLREPSTPDTRK